MEDKFTNQEEQLRSISEKFQLDVDTADLWNQIEGQLPPVQKERRPIAWWFIMGGLVVIGGMLVWSFSTHQNTQNTAEEIPVIKNQAAVAVIAQNTLDTSETHTSKAPL